jgi:predicted ATP-grasp superfamily ATP-dependent carboligase
VTRDSVRVLVTGGEYVGVLAAVRALRAAGYEPWVAVSRRGVHAARSRAAAGVVRVPEPGEHPDEFVAALAAAAERLSIAAVLPGNERALIALTDRPEAFSPGTALGICPPETVALATDKRMLQSLAAEAGLDVPPTIEVTRSASEESDPEIEYPAVVKPQRSELRMQDGTLRHLTVRRVGNADELRLALDALPGRSGLVQRYLHGPLGATAGVFWHGEMISTTSMRAERIWPPGCGTIAYAVSIPADPDFERAIARLLASIGWDGVFQLDWVEVDSRRYVIDLNPRIYTSLALGVSAGANLPAIWVDLLLGRPTSVAAGRVGVRYRHELDDPRALLSTFLDGDRKEALRGLLPRRGTVHAIYSWRDPLPSLASFSKLRERVTSGQPS